MKKKKRLHVTHHKLYTLILLLFTSFSAGAQLPELVVQKGNDDSINCIASAENAKSFLTVCSAESTVKIWEANSGRLLKTIAANAKNASYSADGSHILLDETNQFAVYDALNDSILFFVSRGAQRFSSVSFANNGSWLVASGIDPVVEIKRTKDGATIRTINTKHGKVLSAQLSPDNMHLVTFSEDSTVCMINITNDSTLYELHFPGFMVQNFSFSKTGRYAVINMISPVYYQSEKKVLVETLTGKQIQVEGNLFDISPDEKFLLAERASGGMDMGGTSVYGRDIFNDSNFLGVPFTNFSALGLRGTYSNDGSFFSVWNQYFVSVFDSRNFERTATYRGDSVDYFVAARDGAPNPDNPAITSVSFNSDSKKILFGSATGKVKEMSTLPGSNSIYEIENPFNAIVDAQYIPMHESIFTKAADNLGIVWNMANATVEYVKDLTYFCDLGFDDSIGTTQSQYRRKATFNNTGAFFITKSEVGSTVWRTKNFEKILSTTGYTNDVNTDLFAVSPDGNFVCNIEEEYNGEFKGINIFSANTKDGLPKKIDSIASNEGILVPKNIYFKGDSHHVIELFQSQNLQHPFLLKAIQFKNGVNILAIHPYMRLVDSFGNAIDEGLHSSFSTKLKCYIISNNDSIYLISSSGKIIKRTSIQLQQPQLLDELEFDPEAKYIFIKDAADKKIYAINVETGKPVYFLDNADTSFASISFSSDHKRFILLSDDKTKVSVYNANTGDHITGFKGHTPQLFSAVFSPDGKFILCCAQDGSYEKRDGLTGKLRYTFFLFKDRDYAIILPEGYYYASSRSDVKYLNFRLNNRLYNFSQFDLQFNRPDKILQALGSTDTVLMQAYHSAWIKRITKSGFKEADFTNSTLHVPDVNLQNKETLPAVTSEKNITLSFSLADSAYKIIAYTIYVNDVPIDKMNGTELDEPSNNTIVDETVALDSGINKIEISCINEKGAESRRETFYINYQPAQPQVSKTWFIGIGINYYSKHGFLSNLSYCVKDIRDLVTAFNVKYNNIFIDTLMNDDASKKNVLALKKRLMQTNTQDRVIISFSGHGLSYDDEFYFATSATDPQSPVAQSISYADMEYLLDGIPARKKLLLIDACHSGESDPDETAGGMIMTGMMHPVTVSQINEHQNNSSVEIIDAKSDPAADSLKAFNIFGIMKAAFVDLRKNNGAIVIAASQSDQQAQETRQFENGVFTSCLLDQLKTNNTLGVSELLKRMNNCVAEKTTGQQPAGRQELAESDWRLW
jgi:WD40 repeat protein